nr:MAG TPA: hypothetical protein [Bacteriophage sp.]
MFLYLAEELSFTDFIIQTPFTGEVLSLVFVQALHFT